MTPIVAIVIGVFIGLVVVPLLDWIDIFIPVPSPKSIIESVNIDEFAVEQARSLERHGYSITPEEFKRRLLEEMEKEVL